MNPILFDQLSKIGRGGDVCGLGILDCRGFWAFVGYTEDFDTPRSVEESKQLQAAPPSPNNDQS
jgi:hypothetical protein